MSNVKKGDNKLKSSNAKPAVASQAQKKPTNASSKSQPAKKGTPAKASTSKPANAETPTVPAAPAPPPPPPPMSEEEKIRHKAAIRIQCAWRRHSAQKLLKNLKKEKVDLDERLKKLEQEAYIQMIKIEQQREEKKRLRKLKERQIKQKREARRKKFLEAAYDGNLQEIKFLIDDLEKELGTISGEDGQSLDPAKKKQAVLGLIDCKDANNNTALSEAAAGGSADVCKFLLMNQADPNSKGAFGRTPLWRSAFAGHLNCVQVLLENGGDPRIMTQDGQRPGDAATKDNVIDLLKNWNIQLTDRMLQQIEKTRQQIKQEQINSLEDRKKKAYEEYNLINSRYETVKNELYKCNCELQRLNDEYLLNEQMYGPLIDKKETEKAELTAKHDDLREKSVKARILYRDLLSEFKKEKQQIKKSKSGVVNEEDDGDDDESDGGDDDKDEGIDETKIMKINIKEIDDLILRDLSDAIKNSVEKWPLIIDQNDQASTFLRYRDTNYINCLDMQSMQKDRFRLALIGSIRYGKPFVLDLMQYDQELFEAIKSVCDQIDSQLFTELCNKSLLHQEKYLRLVRLETDGPEYESQNFNKIRLNNFKCLFITSNPYPCDKLVKITMPIKIVASSAGAQIDDLDFY